MGLALCLAQNIALINEVLGILLFGVTLPVHLMISCETAWVDHFEVIRELTRITFAGSQAVAANGGRPVRIESGNAGSADLPLGSFKNGSSISHLDNFTYSYNVSSGRNALMTAFVPALTQKHDPGPITIAMLRDIGWGRVPTPMIVPSIVILSSPMGILAYNWKSVADATYYLVTVRNAATKQVVLNQQVTASVARCAATSAANCSFKPAGTGVLRAGNYEWYVNAGNNVGLGQFSPTMPFTVK